MDRNRFWLNMNAEVPAERQFLQLWEAVSGHLSPKRRGEIIKTIFMSGLDRIGHLYGLDMRQMTVDLDLVHETLNLDKNGRKKRIRIKGDATAPKPTKKSGNKIVVVNKAPSSDKAVKIKKSTSIKITKTETPSDIEHNIPNNATSASPDMHEHPHEKVTTDIQNVKPDAKPENSEAQFQKPIDKKKLLEMF